MDALVKVEADREGISSEKIRHFLATFFQGKTRDADCYLDQFTDIDIERIRALTRKRLRSLLVDIDACIAPAYDEILPQNLQKIEELLDEGVRIGIYSNCKALDRLNPLFELGIPFYDGHLAKPQAEGFLAACRTFDFDPKETWMVGENPNTDGGAVNVLEGMIFVKPIPDNLSKLSLAKRIRLPFQVLFRNLAIYATLRDNDTIIRSHHLHTIQ
ncbi:MAG: hypothetical protein A2V81_02710 [Candidatus Abawacabacteria bacterium RBG_16_42_10]|uniref:HAD family hydrolase n=1 Tax=Candidatus Abawacabacteria bacterium RBG_16_42_10 TaxID=1817814 RepID=A0A1F4XK14_9BACT|nr:MAG: hypothetical protein A2V81_02710 [Candidatus Abawacabacteria bacterium RBG_16_42_10]